jgi:threonine synthase
VKFYSTNNKQHKVSLKDAVIRGLAPDNGLYMPERLSSMPKGFFDSMPNLTFQEIGFEVANHLVGEDVDKASLQRIVNHTIAFDAPLVEVEKNVFSLELFHGPTMAFKDFGARFMSQLLGYFVKQENREVTVLVATSGDTGSAVANGFFDVPGVKVIVLYPSGKVSDIQERQFTTLGKNITALEVDGTFDDCQRLVKSAFLDTDLKSKLFLTSANSINISRLIPQSFYYFYAWSRIKNEDKDKVVFSVPSGNFGNLTAGLIAQRMGLPIYHFVVSTNANDVVPKYLQTGIFNSISSISTISNAMDVGNPSNFARMLDLFSGEYSRMTQAISGYTFTDDQTKDVMRSIHKGRQYILDPHGAVGLLGLKQYQSIQADSTGIFLETAHPAKFKEVVEDVLKVTIDLPDQLKYFTGREKKSLAIKKDFEGFKELLLGRV